MTVAPLACIECDAEHPASVARCPCGGALDFTEPRPAVTAEALEQPGRGHERFLDLLPVEPAAFRTLGEGETPLVRVGELDARFKLEHTNPTGSFKDRGAAVTVAHARALGAERVVEDSSGNAGAATAAYAGRHGLACTIFSPETVDPVKRSRMEALGAEVQVVPGPRAGVTEAAAKAAQQAGTYYANHTYPPHFVEGCTTLAYELVDQLGTAPDVVVTPCAMGSVLLGCARGFERLVAGEVIAEAPRLIAVQAAGFDPVASAFDRASAAGENRLADGLLIAEPPRLDQMVQAIQATDGTALSVDERSTREAMNRLHRRGVLVEPSSAAALAGAEQARELGALDADEQPVIVLTGAWKGPA